MKEQRRSSKMVDIVTYVCISNGLYIHQLTPTHLVCLPKICYWQFVILHKALDKTHVNSWFLDWLSCIVDMHAFTTSFLYWQFFSLQCTLYRLERTRAQIQYCHIKPFMCWFCSLYISSSFCEVKDSVRKPWKLVPCRFSSGSLSISIYFYLSISLLNTCFCQW